MARRPRLRAVPSTVAGATKALDALLQLHDRFYRKGERKALQIIGGTEQLKDALRAPAQALVGDAVTQAKVSRVIEQAQAIQEAHVDAAVKRIAHERIATAGEMAQAIGETMAVDFGVDMAGLTAMQVKALADSHILGATLEQWADKVTPAQQFKLGQELQNAYALGESFDEINRRIEDIAPGFDDELAMLARTGIQTVSNEAAVATYDANQDVLAGQMWVATLDTVTCPICGDLDGGLWYYDGSGEGPVDNMPRAPVHPNCRCARAPIVKDMPIPIVQSWDEWIVRQPAAIQDESLGPGRAALLRAGEITPSDLITKRGALRPLESLRRAA